MNNRKGCCEGAMDVDECCDLYDCLEKSRRQRIPVYLTVTAAASVTLSCSVEAGIHYTSGTWVLNTANTETFLDFDGGGNDARLYFSGGGSTFGAGIDGLGASIGVTATNIKARNFAFNEQIYIVNNSTDNADGGLFYYSTSSGWIPSMHFNGTGGYIGIRLNRATDLYGWIHVAAVAADGSSYTIDGYAYQADGSAINAGDQGGGGGAVPEPSGLALLACGAAGVFALRKTVKRSKV